MSEITSLLEQARDGDPVAWDRVVSLLYADLKRLARGALAGGGVQAHDVTGLVHDCYLRLSRSGANNIVSRAHFLSLAARAMRQLIINHARDRTAVKRGGGLSQTTLEDVDLAVDDEAEELLAIDAALHALAAEDERLVQIVECRLFAGLTDEETAIALGVSVRSVQRLWHEARERLRLATAD
jgi:RNA polymerase sigma factor (TIGR02999 family)